MKPRELTAAGLLLIAPAMLAYQATDPALKGPAAASLVRLDDLGMWVGLAAMALNLAVNVPTLVMLVDLSRTAGSAVTPIFLLITMGAPLGWLAFAANIGWWPTAALACGVSIAEWVVARKIGRPARASRTSPC